MGRPFTVALQAAPALEAVKERPASRVAKYAPPRIVVSSMMVCR
jgi:hypothetical protein